MKKKVFYQEWAYVVGIITLALGTALMERADFGMSMVVAPAYVLFRKLSQTWTFVTFGMMEYMLQAFLLVVMGIVLGRFRMKYLFSFVTAVIYGFSLDAAIALVALIPVSGMAWRVIFFALGVPVCSLGVACLFHTYIAPEAYEMIVKEVSEKYGLNITRFKMVYDISSLLVSVAMSFAFFGMWHFEGVRAGTILCALVNGAVIGGFSRYMENRFEFVRAWRPDKKIPE